MTPSTRSELRAGMLDIAPVVVAVLPIGILFGTIAGAEGLSLFEAVLMSATMFAGAAQFVALDLWQHPAPWALLTLTVFVVNIRHVFMGASLARHLGRFRPRTRGPAMFFMADEIWAFAERRAMQGPLAPAYYWGMGVALWAQWVVGTIIGVVVGQGLGDPAAYGFDFAFTAIFIGILAGFWRGARTGAILTASAMAAVMVKLWVPGAWYIAAGGLAGVALAAALGEEDQKVAQE